MYEKRLLKFVKAHSGLFTAHDVASVWKRNHIDVGMAAITLSYLGALTINKCGVLYAN